MARKGGYSWGEIGRKGGRLCTRGNTWSVRNGCDEEVRKQHTWLVQTLLNVTKANVCASNVEGRSFFASSSGRAKAARNSCGMKARDSSLIEWVEGDADEMWRRVL